MIRVLLADDQELVRDGFAMILDAQDDIDVVGQAADGASSVELARTLTPDVVLMDIRMPVMDGIEATRRIRAAGLHRLAVLILTTFDLDEYVYEALRAGASGFLLKDVPRSTLIQAVRTVAAGDALLAPAITRRLIEQFVNQPPPTRALPRELAELTHREQTCSCDWPAAARTAKSAGNSSSARPPSKPTSRMSSASSRCAIGSRQSSTPTRPASSIPARAKP
jgi:DNA-binding NarL/FixJ family response regulator